MTSALTYRPPDVLLDQLAQRVFVELMGCVGVCFPVRPKPFRSVGE